MCDLTFSDCVPARGIYLAYGRAISLAVPFEDILLNGTVHPQVISMDGGTPALASAMRSAAPPYRYFVAVTPSAAWTHEGPTEPNPTTVSFALDVGSKRYYEVTELTGSGAKMSCGGGDACRITRSLSASAVFVAEPAAPE